MNIKNKSILFPCVLAGLLVVAIVIFCFIISKTHEVRMVSLDREATIILRNASESNKAQIITPVRFRFNPKDNESLFEKSIKKNSSYLYSIENDGSRSNNETGKYLLYKDAHFFIVEEDPEEGAFYTELINFVASDNTPDSYRVYLPVLIRDYSLFSNDPIFISWKETVGLSSFDDLKGYYSQIDDKNYTIDEKNQCIILNSIYEDKDVARLYATDDGIKLLIAKNSNSDQEQNRDTAETVTFINGELVDGKSSEKED